MLIREHPVLYFYLYSENGRIFIYAVSGSL
jgi:hypothetical protein